MIKPEILDYVKNQILRAEDRLHSYTLDIDGTALPKRNAYFDLFEYLNNFKDNKESEPRWLALPGLRGTGKTTLMAQLYSNLNARSGRKLYISLDEAVRSVGASLNEVLQAYEELLGTPFERLQEPIYIFLDEVHYDENWGVILKTLYDKSKKVFVICTGSSALSLQTNADMARRAIFIKIYPMSFTEYIFLKTGKQINFKISENIKNILFNSENAQDVHDNLKVFMPKIKDYWLNIDNTEIDTYLKYGTLPFTIRLKQEALIYSQINHTLNSVLNKDVSAINNFDKSTVEKLSQILYAVSSAGDTNLAHIGNLVELDPKTITSVFAAFEKTELLIRVYPYGSHYKQVRKASKYLFTSPAFRAMYHNLIGSTLSYNDYKGKLFEDVVGLYLYRTFLGNPDIALTYDSSQEGADFILGSRIRKTSHIALEIGTADKNFRQISNTLDKVGGKYGLVISKTELKLSNDTRSVCIPLQVFLML